MKLALHSRLFDNDDNNMTFFYKNRSSNPLNSYVVSCKREAELLAFPLGQMKELCSSPIFLFRVSYLKDPCSFLHRRCAKRRNELKTMKIVLMK